MIRKWLNYYRGLGVDRADPGGAGGQDEGGGDRQSRGQEKVGDRVADIQDPPPEVQIHLRSVLPEEGNFARSL